MIAAVAFTVLLAAALATGTAAWWLRRPAKSEPPAEQLGQVRPAVRLLRTEEELREAVDRAVATERAQVARTSARIDRYARLCAEPASRTELVRGPAAGAGWHPDVALARN